MYKINELQFSLVVLCESMLNHHQEELCRTNVRTQAFIEKVTLDQRCPTHSPLAPCGE